MGIVSQHYHLVSMPDTDICFEGLTSPKYQPTLPSELPGRVKIATVRSIAIARIAPWAACMIFFILPEESNWSLILAVDCFPKSQGVRDDGMTDGGMDKVGELIQRDAAEAWEKVQ